MTTTDFETPKKILPARPKEISRLLGRKARRWLLRLLLLAITIAGILLAMRAREFNQLAANTKNLTMPTVQVVHPQTGPSQVEITLPGDLTAYSEASLFARTNGYLATWFTDLGAKVKAGQLLAEISAPDVDAQRNQAIANLAQMQANQEIAQLNFQREQDLLAKAVASQQEFEQFRATFEAAVAAVKAAQASLDNLTVQQNFQKIVAPFPGIVTARTVDVGDLVTAVDGSTSTAGQALFRLARTDILRVFIDVPQIYSPSVRPGTKALLRLVEFPGQTFEGSVTNISGALDPSTRTLLTEVQVPNSDGRLFPGSYAQVHLVLPIQPALVIPANALLFRAQGLQVGTVDANGIVQLKSVSIGRDFGTTVQLTQGLAPADRVILNPSDSIADGQKVEVAQPAAAP